MVVVRGVEIKTNFVGFASAAAGPEMMTDFMAKSGANSQRMMGAVDEDQRLGHRRPGTVHIKAVQRQAGVSGRFHVQVQGVSRTRKKLPRGRPQYLVVKLGPYIGGFVNQFRNLCEGQLTAQAGCV